MPFWMGVAIGWACWFFARRHAACARDQWIGWTEAQRRRRLPRVVNNCRFLLLPQRTAPTLGSRSLRLALDRLSRDWQERYGHPVLVVETVVYPERFGGTVYTAPGWGSESGLHPRLDASHLDDPCLVSLPKSMRVVGMFRRFSNSLCLHGRGRQSKPHHKTTTDFFAAMNAEHHCQAIRAIHARKPAFRTDS